VATYQITFVDGTEATITAKGDRPEGGWMVFKDHGRDHVMVSAMTVRTIERTDATSAVPAAVRWTAAVVLTVVGCLAVFVGILDIGGAAARSGRLVGALLVVSGALCISAIRDARRPSAMVCVAAIIATFAWLKFHADGWNGSVAVSLALLALTIGLVFVLWSTGDHPKLVPAVGQLAVVGLLIGLGQFWYEKEYLPTSGDPAVTATVELALSPAPGVDGGARFVTATVKLENQSGVTVRLAGTHYNAWRFDPHSPSTDTDRRKDMQLIESGTLQLPVGNWFGPNQQYSETKVFEISAEGLAGVRFDVGVHLVKGDRIPHGKFVSCEGSGCPKSWAIEESSVVRRLTRDRRYLVQLPTSEEVAVVGSSAQATQAVRVVELRTCIAKTPDRCDETDRGRHLADDYGLFRVGAGAELAVEPHS
jgi:hypothetical protein